MRREDSSYLGFALLLIALLVNPWTLLVFSPDGRIDSSFYTSLILLFEALAAVSGGYLIWRRPPLRSFVPSRKEAVTFLVSLGSTLLLLEGGCRVWLNWLASPAQYSRYALVTDVDAEDLQWSPHPYLNHYPTPNFNRGRTSHNSLGFRGQEFILPKPASIFRIVALGGSSTYTVRVEDNQRTYPSQLERLLKEDYGYQNVEVINAGVADYNSWESLINLQFRVLDLEPDLVVVYHGTNDVHARLVDPSLYRGDGLGRRKQWSPPCLKHWERSALLRIAATRMGIRDQVALADFVSSDSYWGWPFRQGNFGDGHELSEILVKNPPVFFQRNLRNMVAVARAHDVQIMVATWAHSDEFGDYASTSLYRTGFDQNNAALAAVAQQEAVPLFDFARLMPQERRYWADGRHVNEEGALLKARLFAKFIHEQGMIPASVLTVGQTRR